MKEMLKENYRLKTKATSSHDTPGLEEQFDGEALTMILDQCEVAGRRVLAARVLASDRSNQQ
jgi:hypothetical protein